MREVYVLGVCELDMSQKSEAKIEPFFYDLTFQTFYPFKNLHDNEENAVYAS